MEQVPSWLELAVFAAGITAYADEVEAFPLHAPVFDTEPLAAPKPPLH